MMAKYSRIHTPEVSHAIVLAVVLASTWVVPLHSKPIAFRATHLSDESHGAYLRGEGQSLR